MGKFVFRVQMDTFSWNEKELFAVCGCSVRVCYLLGVSYILGFHFTCIIWYMHRGVELPPWEEIADGNQLGPGLR